MPTVARALPLFALAALLAATGCARGPQLLPADQRHVVDRASVEYPAGYELKPLVVGLTAPTALCFDPDGTLLIAEGGIGGAEPRIFGYRTDGTLVTLYPPPRINIPLTPIRTGFDIHGPIGGLLFTAGRVYASHRDTDGRGVITAFAYDGTHETIVANLPAQGDYGVTDLAVAPNGRIYFGVGSATNSGVVGIDNWQTGWVDDHRDVADAPSHDLKLLGYRFDTPNPKHWFFSADIAVTAPFQPFGRSKQTRVPRARNDKPNAAVYSVSPTGGDVRVEATGIRNPRGLAFNEFGRLFITNNGMELRGTRPVANDPDALLRFVPGAWYGWPDFSADLFPIAEPRFQPPAEMVGKTGYPDIGSIIDHAASGLLRPDRAALLQSTLPHQGGAAKLDFVPPDGPFTDYRGNAVIALAGDTAPFANGGRRLDEPTGYCVVRVDENRQVRDFIRNTQPGPAHRHERTPDALERPVDVKFGPDGALYIVDFGRLDVPKGSPKVAARTGRIWILTPAARPTAAPRLPNP